MSTLRVVRLTVANPDELLSAGVLGPGALIRLERSATGGGSGYSEIATIPIVSLTYAYTYYDTTVVASPWYRARYSNAGNTTQTVYGAEFQSAQTSLLTLRQRLNDELSVTDDNETIPWSKAYRNRAIEQGYSALWTHGVWMPVTLDLTVSGSTMTYAVSGIQVLERAALLDTTGELIEDVPAAELRREGDTFRVTTSFLPDGYVLRLYGFTPYKSSFTSDTDVDDLPPEWVYIPLLRAAAVCYRQARSRFARYGSRQTVPPEMNLTIEQLLALEAQAMREFEIECKALADRRPRVGRRLATWRGV